MNKRKIHINPDFEYLRDWILYSVENFEICGELISQKRNVLKVFFAPNGSKYMIKRFKRPNLLQTLIYSFFRKTKAMRAFCFAEYLNAHCVTTPNQVAYIEDYQHSLLGYSYFISEYKQQDTCWILNDDISNTNLIQSLALYIYKMHSCGFLHGDMNLSNFLYYKKNEVYVISTVDINRSVIIKAPSQKQCLLTFRRLSHEIATLRLIVSEYAQLRNWSVDYCVNYVLNSVKRLERHEDIRGFLTNKEPEYRKRKRLKWNGHLINQ